MTNANRLIDGMKTVKVGLEVFGVEKRIKELENRPQIVGTRGSSAHDHNDIYYTETEIDEKTRDLMFLNIMRS